MPLTHSCAACSLNLDLVYFCGGFVFVGRCGLFGIRREHGIRVDSAILEVGTGAGVGGEQWFLIYCALSMFAIVFPISVHSSVYSCRDWRTTDVLAVYGMEYSTHVRMHIYME